MGYNEGQDMAFFNRLHWLFFRTQRRGPWPGENILHCNTVSQSSVQQPSVKQSNTAEMTNRFGLNCLCNYNCVSHPLTAPDRRPI